MTTSSQLLLIDGHSMAYRAFHALPADKFVTAGGQATNAVYGFISMLINLLRDENPTHLAVAFDVSRASFRTRRYSDYKATRSASPPEFSGQVSLIQQVLEAMAVPSLTLDDYEADDILATLATKAAQEGFDVLVSSGDRDTFQLITDHITVLYPKKGVSDLVRMSPTHVQDKYGVSPQNYRDLAALVGEKSDNLPGVPGVGPKTAAKWITQFGSLQALLEHKDDIGGKVGQALRDHAEGAKLNYELNYLVTDLDLPAVSTLERRPWNREELHQIFDTLQFKTLRERLYAAIPNAEEEQAREVEFTYQPYQPGTLESWLQDNASAGRLTALWSDPGFATVAVSSQGMATAFAMCELAAADKDALAHWLEDPDASKIGHDLKPQIKAAAGCGYQIAGVHSDTVLAAFLILPGQRSYDLADLVLRYVKRHLDPISDTSQLSLDIDVQAVDSRLRQAALMAAAIEQLYPRLAEQLREKNGEKLLTEVELPTMTALADMELAGIAVDRTQLVELETQFARRMDAAAASAQEIVGRGFNVSSPKQLQEILFGELGLPKTKRIKTGYTTDAEALQSLLASTGHPVLAHIVDYRDAAKLRVTVEGLLKSIADDSRIHTTFAQTIAATGRLSSIDPNLQNIPIRTAEGRKIRQAFVVGKGYDSLLTADYSQLEMRIMAHLSQDAELIAAFCSGEDVHTTVAARVFDVSQDQVSAEHRRKIKAMSYGLAYGLSSYGLSQQLGVPVSEAATLMEEYFRRFGRVRDYLQAVVDHARETGFTETVLGRRRYLPDLNSDNRQRREMAERMALNAPIQGSAADIVKVAMLRVNQAIAARQLRSRLLLQVHDELVCEVASGEREQLSELVEQEMGAAYRLSVPLAVSVGYGASWHEAAH